MKSGGILFFLVVLLFSAGLLMVFNTTSAELLDKGQEGQIYHALIKQFIASNIRKYYLLPLRYSFWVF